MDEPKADWIPKMGIALFVIGVALTTTRRAIDGSIVLDVLAVLLVGGWGVLWLANELRR